MACVLAACSAHEAPNGADTNVGELAQAFHESATNAGVPRDLLVAIAQVEEGLTLPKERPNLEVDTHVPAAGPLMLRRGKLDTLARGAALTNATELALRQHADLALRAGALVLAELGAKSGAREDDLESWQSAIEDMGGYADDAHRKQYAHRVFATLARGGSFEGRDGQILELPPHDLPPTLTLDVDTQLHTLGLPEFSGAEVFPTSCNNKCQGDRSGVNVTHVVIHDTEGSWNSAVATLQNDPNKSVHYIVGTDGRVGQFVAESIWAWHAGNAYYNQRSVGIEHVGTYLQPYPEAEYVASAKLVNYLTAKYKIKPDRAHIIGHNQIPDGNAVAQSAAPCSMAWKDCGPSYGGSDHHTDPGVWEWATYMPRIGGAAKCNDAWNLWNCSSDKQKAFRCANGAVEVQSCVGGCQSQSDGVDDTCVGEPTTGGDDAGGSQSGADASSGGDHDTGTPSTDPPEPSSGLDAGAHAPSASPGKLAPLPEEEPSACSIAGGVGQDAKSSSHAFVTLSFFATIAAVMSGRRTRRRRDRRDHD